MVKRKKNVESLKFRFKVSGNGQEEVIDLPFPIEWQMVYRMLPEMLERFGEDVAIERYGFVGLANTQLALDWQRNIHYVFEEHGFSLSKVFHRWELQSEHHQTV